MHPGVTATPDAAFDCAGVGAGGSVGARAAAGQAPGKGLAVGRRAGRGGLAGGAPRRPALGRAGAAAPDRAIKREQNREGRPRACY